MTGSCQGRFADLRRSSTAVIVMACEVVVMAQDVAEDSAQLVRLVNCTI